MLAVACVLLLTVLAFSLLATIPPVEAKPVELEQRESSYARYAAINDYASDLLARSK